MSQASTRGGFPWRLFFAFLVALAALAGVAYYTWLLRQDHLQTVDELARVSATAATAEQARQRQGELGSLLDACESALQGEKDRAKAVEDSVESMRADLSATRAELDDLREQREQTARRLAAFKKMTAKFQKMIDSGQLDVVIRDGKMLVNLPASVLFESGSADLSRAGELALMEVAVVLRDFDDRQFMVVGHTDDRPLESSETSRYRNNWELSTARAVTVVNFLIEARMDPSSLIAAGLGEHAPVARNNSAKGRQQNRRIEIVLMPKLEELPPMPDPAAASEDQSTPEKTED